LLLDGGRRRIAGGCDGGLDFFGQAKMGEGHETSNG
jgi:hypothetical protein